jgi:hypothetical protein
MDHPKDVGDRSALAVAVALQHAGFAVYVPFGENTRADFITDDGLSLRRVQCKTGRLRAGAVVWNVCSHYGHHRNPRQLRRDYVGEVDDFAVYCPETCGVYLIPIADLPIRVRGALRIDPPKNNQQKFIRYAAHYEIGRVEIHAPESPLRLGRVDEVVG